jgi:hypothetical protein
MWRVLAILLLLPVLSVAHAATPAEIMAANRGAVVYLEFQGTDAAGVPLVAAATGFLVSADGLVLTARHSVEDQQGKPKFFEDSYTIRGALGSREEDLRRLEVVEKGQADVLLLRFRGNRTDYPVVKVCSGVTAELGDRLVTLGFPKEQDLSIIDGLLSNKSQNEWQTSVPFTYGYSGGPVFAEDDGQLVGLVQGGIQQAASISFFTPIHRATSILQNGGVDVPRCGEIAAGGGTTAAPQAGGVSANNGSIAIGGNNTGSKVTINNNN